MKIVLKKLLTMSALSLAIAIVCAVSVVAHSSAASFDCAKAIQPIEITICGNDELSALDSALAGIYQAKEQALGGEQKKDLLQSQREWLGKRVTQCHLSEAIKGKGEVDSATTSCVSNLYRERFKEIASIKSKPSANAEAERLYVEGQGEYDALRYRTALDVWKKAAVFGSGKAMKAIGDLDDFGVGVREDHTTSMQWWLKASDAGDTEAMLAIGDSYYQGKIRPHDEAQAAKWWDMAAAEGDSKGMAARAYAFQARGDSIDANIWFRLSADEGNVDAMFALCGLYRQGQGIPPDSDQSQLWCDKAKSELSQRSKSGDIPAMKKLSEFSRQNGDAKGGLDWLMKAADLGDADAADHLANIYKFGDFGYSVSADRTLALIWRTKAAQLLAKRAEAGDVRAMISLGFYEVNAAGKTQSCESKLTWLHRAASLGSNEAMIYLGSNYYYGNCTAIDYGKSRYWLNRALILGDQGANEILTKMPGDD